MQKSKLTFKFPSLCFSSTLFSVFLFPEVGEEQTFFYLECSLHPSNYIEYTKQKTSLLSELQCNLAGEQCAFQICFTQGYVFPAHGSIL